jgi:hypothetical protein
MDINISCSANEHIRIFINGNLAGEVAINELESHSNLLQEIEQARSLKALPKIVQSVVNQVFKLKNFEDHVNTTEAKKQSAYTQGVIDGLNKIKIPFPTTSSAPDILPRYDPSYERGYQNGEFLINLLNSLDNAQT